MKVKFLGTNGYELELNRAMKTFDVGQILEVESLSVDVNSSRSDVAFKGYNGMYNSIMFCVIDCNEDPEHRLSCYSKCFNVKNVFHIFDKEEPAPVK